MEKVKVHHAKNCVKKNTLPNCIDAYKNEWSPLHKLFKDEMQYLSEDLFDHLFDFIFDCSKSWIEHMKKDNNIGDVVTAGCSVVHHHEIPTAILLAGVNTPDHQSIYDRICSSVLKRNGRVAVVNPGSDTVSSRALISSVVDKLTHGSTHQTNEFPSAVRSTYLALSEWFYAKIYIDVSRRKDNPVSTYASDINTPMKSAKSMQQRSTLRGNSRCTPIQINKRRHTARPTVSQPFDEQCNQSLPKSAHSSLDGIGPLVIILPQVEAIATPVLQEFIELTSMYVTGDKQQSPIFGNSLPICLVLGLATSAQVGFESRLSASTLSRIRAKQFTVPPPAVFLDSVLETLVNRPGFHLSYPIHTYLVDSLFLCLDYSVNNFIDRVRFCMLEHYLTTPHSELLSKPDQAHEYLLSLPATELANILSLQYPSVSTFVTENGDRLRSPPHPIAQQKARKQTATVVDRLVDWLESHWHVHCMLQPLLVWLSHIFGPLGTSPLGKTVPHLYRSWLKDDLYETEAFSLTVNLLSGVPRENFLIALDRANLTLQSKILRRNEESNAVWPDNILHSGVDRLDQFLQTCRKWYHKLDQANVDLSPIKAAVHHQHQVSNMDAIKSSPMFDGKRKMSLRGLRQHLQELAAASPKAQASPKSRRSSAWDRERSSFLDWMQKELATLIPSPCTLPLYEVFYGPNVPLHAIRNRFNPSLQKNVHQALIDPNTYLKIPEFKLTNIDSLTANLPDLCIIYKLYLECGKMINLYDWLMAFSTVLGEDVDKENPPSQIIQARFFHALAQLNFLGFIKSTRRKADHVLRLTLGFEV